MNSDAANGIVWLVVGALVVVALYAATRKPRGPRRGGPGIGATGAVYDMLNEDKRNAIEIILEERAEARDPEDKDGDLPQLEKPRKNL